MPHFLGVGGGGGPGGFRVNPSDKVEQSSKNFSKMVSADVKQQEQNKW